MKKSNFLTIFLFPVLIFLSGLNEQITAQDPGKINKEIQQNLQRAREISAKQEFDLPKDYEMHVPGEYESIQEALKVAPDGATILVSGKTAASFAVLGQENIKILATGNTSIEGEYMEDMGLNATFVISRSNNILIEGFDFTGGGYIAYSSEVEIKDCKISGPGDGINLLFSEKNLFTDNILQHNTGNGIEMGSGFYIYASDENKFHSNKIQGNEAFGIILYFSNYNNFSNNEIDQNVAGIELNSHSTGNNISDNNISNTKLWGIRLVDNANDNDLTNNHFQNNQGSGLIISRSGNNCIFRGKIDNSGYAGISILDMSSENNLIEDVLVTNNFIGVEMALGASDSFFKNCDIRENSICDIRDFDEANSFAGSLYNSRNCP